MVTKAKLITAADLMDMDEDAPFELIRGELVEVSPAKLRHALVAGRFVEHFVLYSTTTFPGRVLVAEGGFFLERDPDSVIAPDVAFMRAERVPPKEVWDQYAQIAPDVVVEVLSPSNTRRRIAQKVEIYLKAGALLVLVADPNRETVTVHTGDGRTRVYRVGEELDAGDALPGFRVPIADLFK
ncbi:MAG: Uma2 family endonuclease [Thermomicrobiales bacterium]